MPLPHKPMDGSDGRVELLAVPSPVMIMNVHVITVSFIVQGPKLRFPGRQCD